MHRMGTGLTQDEVAFLLGSGDGTAVSHYESFRRLPTLRTALAYMAIHRSRVEELFPGEYYEVVALVLDRARRLREALGGRPDAKRKVELINALIRVLEQATESV